MANALQLGLHIARGIPIAAHIATSKTDPTAATFQ
jgi:hypothetical protein